MKRITHLSVLGAVFALSLGVHAADMLQYRAKPGSKMRIDGTSSVHDWSAESVLVSGRMTLDPSFPTDPSSKELKPGKLEATADVSVGVRTFRCSSGEAMDAVMRESMDAKNHPRIEYKLKELVFKEFKDNALVFDSTGDLTVHGQTKSITMPVQITRVDAKNLKITGNTSVKMTDFGIQPPAPKLLPIKTGDEVKLAFEWNLQQAAPATAG